MSGHDPEEGAYAAYDEASGLVAAIYEAADELDVHLADDHWEQVRADIEELLRLVKQAEQVCAELLDLRQPGQATGEEVPAEIHLPVFTPVDASLVPADTAGGEELDPGEIAVEALGDARNHLRELARIASDEASEASAAANDGKRRLSVARFTSARLAAERCERDYPAYQLMLNQVGVVTGTYPGVAGIAVEGTESAIRDHEIERELQDIVKDERPRLGDSDRTPI